MCLDAKSQPVVLFVMTPRLCDTVPSWMSCRLLSLPRLPSLPILRRLFLRCWGAGHLCFLSVSLLLCSCSTEKLSIWTVATWSLVACLSSIAICRPKKKGFLARSKMPFKKADQPAKSPAPPEVSHNLTPCKFCSTIMPLWALLCTESQFISC